jgi:uncharacterized peroxidase-related enzyme
MGKAYIDTKNSYPGILGLLWFKPSTGAALGQLTQALMHGPSGLTSGERELIASHVSSLNECSFCCDSHSAAAAAHLSDAGLVEEVKRDFTQARISPKMKALLKIASQVQKGGRNVRPADVEAARQAGASDEDIHDAVLVAAAFCMFNRYVDGLGTTPARKDDYREMGERIAFKGYRFPPGPLRWLVKRVLNRKFSSNLSAGS